MTCIIKFMEILQLHKNCMNLYLILSRFTQPVLTELVRPQIHFGGGAHVTDSLESVSLIVLNVWYLGVSEI